MIFCLAPQSPAQCAQYTFYKALASVPFLFINTLRATLYCKHTRCQDQSSRHPQKSYAPASLVDLRIMLGMVRDSNFPFGCTAVLWRHRGQKVYKQVRTLPPSPVYAYGGVDRYVGMSVCNSTRVQQIQAEMTYRALELLNLPPDEPAFLLDIGCGSGLSGEILDEEGYHWVGCDIAPSMLGEPEPSTNSQYPCIY